MRIFKALKAAALRLLARLGLYRPKWEVQATCTFGAVRISDGKISVRLVE